MIIPGILEKDFQEIQKKIDLLDSHTELAQIDIADGMQVDGKTFLEIGRLNGLNAVIKLEIHLMVQNPAEYVLKIDNATRFLAQVESGDMQDFIDKSKNFGYETGLSISPETPNHFLDPYLNQINYVQFMGVVPGAQNRPFEPKVMEKIKQFRLFHPDMPIQVDGHMNKETIDMLKPLKVDNYVVGSDIFNDVDPIKKLKELQNYV